MTDFRPATVGDLAGLRRLFAEALPFEPIHRAALADLMFHRPPADPALRLVAAERGAIVGAAFGALHDGTGYIDAAAVAPARRRAGLGGRLLGELEARLQEAGARSLKIGGNAAHYAWPGLDLRYTAALCLAERAGYRRVGTAQNMTVDLASWVPAASPVPAVELRRAHPEDRDELAAFIGARFGPAWLREAGVALDRAPATAFVALRAERIVGFACHGVYRADWFGPLGVDADERGNGIGEALLRACLAEQAAAGMATAQIPWVGPVRFYSRAVGAYCDRIFALLEK